MNLFKRLHGRLVPPGMEVEILKRLPRITLFGLLFPVAMALLVRAMPPEPGVDTAKHIMTVDIFAIAVTITFLTAIFTIAIGCVVVHVMKGPAYVADSYPVAHADRPTEKRESVQTDSVADMHRKNQEDDRKREDFQ